MIGVFDSGVGGLCSFERLNRLVRSEELVYLADKCNAPYGTRTRDEIISLAKRNIQFERPVTHDLFKNFAKAYGTTLKYAKIENIFEGTFYSRLVFTDGEHEKEIDARTSDAVAIAMRCDAPIYIEDELLNTLCIKEEWENAFSIPITLAGTDTLREVMQRAIEEENYELAMKLKQELDSRTRNNDTGVKPSETMNN